MADTTTILEINKEEGKALFDMCKYFGEKLEKDEVHTLTGVDPKCYIQLLQIIDAFLKDEKEGEKRIELDTLNKVLAVVNGCNYLSNGISDEERDEATKVKREVYETLLTRSQDKKQ